MRRPLLFGLIAGGLVFVVLVVLGIVTVVGVVDRNDALAEHGTASSELAGYADDSEAALADADAVLAVGSDPLLPPEAVAAVTTERDAAAAALDEATTLLRADVEELDPDQIRELSSDLRSASDDIRADDERVRTAVQDLVLATRDGAAAVEAANFDAENEPHLAFRAAVADFDIVSVDTLLGYLDAAHALEASHAAEIASKSGALLDQRLAAEAFARSIAGGVLLDFDWAVTVNGYGTGGSYGGTSYWWSDRGGYATITLSDSVAAMWPGAGVQSLVAHEVGHAILSKCTNLFFGTEYEAGGEEPWATAWAIGMGYTSDGNGESIYGRPPDALIQLSTQCR
jgi:hypothetical protein